MTGSFVIKMEYYDDIIRAREIIKKKYNELRRGESEESARLEKYFKPVAEPLKAILRKQEDAAGPTNWLQVKKEEEEAASKAPLEKNTEGQYREKEDPYESAVDSDFDDEQTGDNIIINTEKTSNQDDTDVDEELDEIASETQEPAGDQDVLLDSYIGAHFGPLFSSYMREMITNGDAFDYSHGIRFSEGGQWLLGNKPVHFDKNDNLMIEENKFEMSPGLLELIFKRSPESYNP